MKIGIFWFYNQKVIGVAHEFNISEADSIGLVDSTFVHVEYWKILQHELPELCCLEYEDVPRGRAIFDCGKGKLIIYLDQKLLFKSKVEKIYSFFDVPDELVILRKDPHYKT